VTTEVVAWWSGAAQLQVCKSRREGYALDAGGSESLYAEIEDFERSEQLSDRHKAALRYVDRLIWSPSGIDTAVAAGCTVLHRSAFFELTLDVMRTHATKHGGEGVDARKCPKHGAVQGRGRRKTVVAS